MPITSHCSIDAAGGTQTHDRRINGPSFAVLLPELHAIQCSSVQLARVRIAEFGTWFETRSANSPSNAPTPPAGFVSLSSAHRASLAAGCDRPPPRNDRVTSEE